MRITKEQEKILDALTCERLRDDESNIDLIQNFENKQGELIVDYLKKNGKREDKNGTTAFYVVKTKSGDVLMFFSLKCGELFVPFDEEEIKSDYQERLILLQAILNSEAEPEEKQSALEQLLSKSIDKGIPAIQVLSKLIKEQKTQNEIIGLLNDDDETEQNVNVARVSRTYPGIELVHFCTNDKAKKIWESYNINRPMGEVIFWRFIALKFYAVQDIVGCEYAFLFAADLSEDRTLINYYNVALKFEVDVEVGTTKPLYDLACVFMCQRLESMRINRDRYFENFNPDEMDVQI